MFVEDDASRPMCFEFNGNFLQARLQMREGRQRTTLTEGLSASCPSRAAPSRLAKD